MSVISAIKDNTRAREELAAALDKWTRETLARLEAENPGPPF